MSDSKPQMWAILPLRDSKGSVQPLFNHVTRADDPVANFGWSYIEGCDLRELKKIIDTDPGKWQTEWVEKGLADVWNKAVWLNNIQDGDYLLYINVPIQDQVTLVKAIKNKNFNDSFAPCYQYSSDPKDSIEGDGFHQICIEKEIWTFDRNDTKIVGEYSVWLKNRSNHWAIDDRLKELIIKAKADAISARSAPTPKFPLDPFKDLCNWIKNAIGLASDLYNWGHYKIEDAIGHGFWGQILVLGGLALFGISFAATCLFLINSSLPFLDYMWNSLQLVLDTGNLAGVKESNSTAAAIVLSMLLTLFGLFVFGGIVGILEKFLETYLKRLQQGLTEIMEKDHIVILGWTDDSISLIEEFIQSDNAVNKVVILSEQSTEEIYHQINELKGKYRHSKTKFIVREGNIHDESRLKKLKLLHSKNIILGADNDEANFKTLLTLVNLLTITNSQKKSKDINVMAPIFDLEYYASFKAVENAIRMAENLTILLVNKRDILQKIVAQSILDIYTVPIYKDLFSYQGAELFLKEGLEYLNEKKYLNNTAAVSLEISTDFIPMGVRTSGKQGEIFFENEYPKAVLETGKIIYLSVGNNININDNDDISIGQGQILNFKDSDIKRVYLIGNTDMGYSIEKELVANTKETDWKKDIIVCKAFPDNITAQKIKNSLIFYISGSEEEDIDLVKMYLKDSYNYSFSDPGNKVIASLLIDSEAIFRISEKVLEEAPCVISNQIVKRMLAQASISTELLSIYEYLLGSSPNTKEIITTPAEDDKGKTFEDYKGKTFKELYEKLKVLDDPYFLMGYVKGGRTVLCPNVDEKLEDIERLIILGERDNMDFNENKGFYLKAVSRLF